MSEKVSAGREKHSFSVQLVQTDWYKISIWFAELHIDTKLTLLEHRRLQQLPQLPISSMFSISVSLYKVCWAIKLCFQLLPALCMYRSHWLFLNFWLPTDNHTRQIRQHSVHSVHPGLPGKLNLCFMFTCYCTCTVPGNWSRILVLRSITYTTCRYGTELTYECLRTSSSTH
jgi:hypothetical protein